MKSKEFFEKIDEFEFDEPFHIDFKDGTTFKIDGCRNNDEKCGIVVIKVYYENEEVFDFCIRKDELDFFHIISSRFFDNNNFERIKDKIKQYKS